MTTTTEAALAEPVRLQGPTLPELIAAQLCSMHTLNGRLMRMSATADGDRVLLDVGYPFPPEHHIRVLLHVSDPNAATPAEIVDEAAAAESGVEIGASA